MEKVGAKTLAKPPAFRQSRLKCSRKTSYEEIHSRYKKSLRISELPTHAHRPSDYMIAEKANFQCRLTTLEFQGSRQGQLEEGSVPHTRDLSNTISSKYDP